MNGATVAAIGMGGAGTGLVTEWLWNDVLPRLFMGPLDITAWPAMEDPVAIIIGGALLGGLRYVTAFLPQPQAPK